MAYGAMGYGADVQRHSPPLACTLHPPRCDRCSLNSTNLLFHRMQPGVSLRSTCVSHGALPSRMALGCARTVYGHASPRCGIWVQARPPGLWLRLAVRRPALLQHLTPTCAPMKLYAAVAGRGGVRAYAMHSGSVSNRSPRSPGGWTEALRATLARLRQVCCSLIGAPSHWGSLIGAPFHEGSERHDPPSRKHGTARRQRRASRQETLRNPTQRSPKATETAQFYRRAYR